jgi:hypothetical protein
VTSWSCLNNYQDHVHAAHDLKYQPALDRLPTSLSIQNNRPVLTQCTDPPPSVCPNIQFELQKQDAPSIYSQNSPLSHRYCRQNAPPLRQNRPNSCHVPTRRLVQQGFRGGKTPRKAIIRCTNPHISPKSETVAGCICSL